MDSKITLPEPISLDGPEVNVPLLRRAVEWAEAEAAKPERESEWYQAATVADGPSLGRTCVTAYCIAGYVASLHGVDYGDPRTLGDGLMGYARGALGLTGSEANSDNGLFHPDNTIADVRRIAERIAARAGERL